MQLCQNKSKISSRTFSRYFFANISEHLFCEPILNSCFSYLSWPIIKSCFWNSRHFICVCISSFSLGPKYTIIFALTLFRNIHAKYFAFIQKTLHHRLDPLSANPTKWSNPILWVWRLNAQRFRSS